MEINLEILSDHSNEPLEKHLADQEFSRLDSNGHPQCLWLMDGILCARVFVTFEDLMQHFVQGHGGGSASSKMVCHWLTDERPCGGKFRRDAFRRHSRTHDKREDSKEPPPYEVGSSRTSEVEDLGKGLKRNASLSEGGIKSGKEVDGRKTSLKAYSSGLEEAFDKIKLKPSWE